MCESSRRLTVTARRRVILFMALLWELNGYEGKAALENYRNGDRGTSKMEAIVQKSKIELEEPLERNHAKSPRHKPVKRDIHFVCDFA